MTQCSGYGVLQGVVDEVVVDDMFQPQGVLVRLQEDNTMGHVARILASLHRQQQQEWPSLLQGTGEGILARLHSFTKLLFTYLPSSHVPTIITTRN